MFFFDHDELVANGLGLELDEIFDGIDRESVPLTEELLNKIKAIEVKYGRLDAPLSKARAALETELDSTIGKAISNNFKGLSVVSKQSAKARQRTTFLAEWNDTLQLIRQISEKVVEDEFRPNWIKRDVPKGVQVDQFLHAYYYTTVKPGQKSSHRELHQKNQNNPNAALTQAMRWWKTLPSAPSSESEMIYEFAPFLFNSLSPTKLRTLTQEEFLRVCRSINAFGTAARQCKNKTLGLPEKTQFEQPERVKVVSNWIFGQSAGNGRGILDVLYYVLYGGSSDDVCDRLWQAAFTHEWHIPQFGLSCLGEIIGWAMPDKYPPRNGRTSKALFALGFNVKIYSE